MLQPVEKVQISCEYGTPGKLWKAGHHLGRDYAGKRGDEIKAIADAKVIFWGRGGWGAAYGNHVVLQIDGLRWIFAHMDSINVDVVKRGHIKAGDLIGLMGATGNVTGVHCHVEARKEPYRYQLDVVDPRPYFDDHKPAAKKAATKTTVAKSGKADKPAKEK